jgi:hypothetical protein
MALYEGHEWWLQHMSDLGFAQSPASGRPGTAKTCPPSSGRACSAAETPRSFQKLSETPRSWRSDWQRQSKTALIPPLDLDLLAQSKPGWTYPPTCSMEAQASSMGQSFTSNDRGGDAGGTDRSWQSWELQSLLDPQPADASPSGLPILQECWSCGECWRD